MKIETLAINAGAAVYLAALLAAFLVFGLVQLCISLAVAGAYGVGTGVAVVRRFARAISSALRPVGTNACGIDGSTTPPKPR